MRKALAHGLSLPLIALPTLPPLLLLLLLLLLPLLMILILILLPLLLLRLNRSHETLRGLHKGRGGELLRGLLVRRLRREANLLLLLLLLLMDGRHCASEIV